MIAERGVTFFELDRRASTDDQPYGIITADCSDPREIDDGIMVEALPSNTEMYRVTVCVADTSKLYDNRTIYKQAMTNMEARYGDLPGGERTYTPMIDPEPIRDLEFTAGQIRGALMISFIMGKKVKPVDLEVKFGTIEVVQNMNYRDFSFECKQDKPKERFGRASALLIKHLNFTSGGDADDAASYNFGDIHSRLTCRRGSEWSKGSKINEAYMVAANHLVGAMLAREGRPAIYRVHDRDDESFLEFLPPDLATYTATPGFHQGLNLDTYCRVTSPLRRLEDFMMSHQLRQRAQSKEPTMRDRRDIALAVQRLNGMVIRKSLEGPLRLNGFDSMKYRRGRPTAQGLLTDTNVIDLHPRAAATA